MATNPIDLFEVIEKGKISCPADLGGGSYLPQSVLDEYVREPYITTCCDEADLPKDVAVTIDRSTRKIFAILLLSDKINIVGLMLGCGLRDQHLPLSLGQGNDTLLSRSGAVFRPCSSGWSPSFRRAILAFLRNQWIVDPPILDDSGEHHIFDAELPLPFLDRLNPLSLGTAAKVFDCTIHPGHFHSVDDMALSSKDNDDAVTEVQHVSARAHTCSLAYPTYCGLGTARTLAVALML